MFFKKKRTGLMAANGLEKPVAISEGPVGRREKRFVGLVKVTVEDEVFPVARWHKQMGFDRSKIKTHQLIEKMDSQLGFIQYGEYQAVNRTIIVGVMANVVHVAFGHIF